MEPLGGSYARKIYTNGLVSSEETPVALSPCCEITMNRGQSATKVILTTIQPCWYPHLWISSEWWGTHFCCLLAVISQLAVLCCCWLKCLKYHFNLWDWQHTVRQTMVRVFSLYCSGECILYTACGAELQYLPSKLTFGSPAGITNLHVLGIFMSLGVGWCWGLNPTPSPSFVLSKLFVKGKEWKVTEHQQEESWEIMVHPNCEYELFM